jgi:hypothetical protein
MEPAAVVEDLDVFGDGEASLGCVKDLGQFLALLIKQRLLLVGGL